MYLILCYVFLFLCVRIFIVIYVLFLVFCFIVLCCVLCVSMCTVLIPPAVNLIAVNKYINITDLAVCG
jgi:hypothetical protein